MLSRQLKNNAAPLETPTQRSHKQPLGRAPLEAAARAVLETRLGRPLKELEWERGRARLLEFANTLLAWDRQAPKQKRGVDNVVIMPKPRRSPKGEAA